jgi:hypothetical protein
MGSRHSRGVPPIRVGFLVRIGLLSSVVWSHLRRGIGLLSLSWGSILRRWASFTSSSALDRRWAAGIVQGVLYSGGFALVVVGVLYLGVGLLHRQAWSGKANQDETPLPTISF